MSRVPATTPPPEGDPFMTRNISTFRSIVTRCLAAGVLLCIYCIGIVGTSALVLAASSTTADARGGGGGRGGGVGGGGFPGGGFRGGGFRGGGFRGGGFRGGGFRGRGWGWGWGGYVEPGC